MNIFSPSLDYNDHSDIHKSNNDDDDDDNGSDDEDIPTLLALIASSSTLCDTRSERHHSFRRIFSPQKLVFPTKSADIARLKISVANLSKQLVKNNPTTRNFNYLVHLFLIAVSPHRSNHYQNELPFEIYNLIVTIRLFLEKLIHIVSPTRLKSFFDGLSGDFDSNIGDATVEETKPAPTDGEIDDTREAEEGQCPPVHVFLETLFDLVIHLPPTNAGNYELYLQILKTLMILFFPHLPCINVSSSPHYTNFNHTEVIGPGSILFFDVWLSDLSVYIRPLLSTLLNNFVECVSQPTEYTGLILSTYNYLFASPEPAESSELSSISSHSILLFAGLVCCPHFGRVKGYSENRFEIPSNDSEIHEEHNIEMARSAVAKIIVFDRVIRQIADSNGRTDRNNVIELSFKKLFEEMIRKIQYEECTLLLYLFLLRNSGFRNYALSRTDPDTLLLPLLQLLSRSLTSPSNKSSSEANRPSQPTSHTLVTLCLLLSLSTDTSYLHSLKDITLPSTPLWYPDRRYSQPSLISVWVGVVIKVLSVNLGKWRDQNIHDVVVALVTNLREIPVSGEVMEKILSLFEFFCKRYSRLVISSTSSSSSQQSSSPATSGSSTPSSSTNTSPTDLSIITSVNNLHSSGTHPSTNTSTSNIKEIHDLNIYRNLISFLLDTIFIMLFGSSSSSSPSSFSFSYSSHSSIFPTPPGYSNNPVKSSDRVQESGYVRKPSVNTLTTTLKKWNIPVIHVCLVKMELFHWILKNICHDKGEIGGRKKQERTAVNKDTAGQNKERCKVSNVEDIGHKHEMKWQVLTSIIIEFLDQIIQKLNPSSTIGASESIPEPTKNSHLDRSYFALTSPDQVVAILETVVNGSGGGTGTGFKFVLPDNIDIQPLQTIVRKYDYIEYNEIPVPAPAEDKSASMSSIDKSNSTNSFLEQYIADLFRSKLM